MSRFSLQRARAIVGRSADEAIALVSLRTEHKGPGCIGALECFAQRRAMA